MFGWFSKKDKAAPMAEPQPTHDGPAEEWIVALTEHKLTVHDLGPFATEAGRVTFIDPLICPTEAPFHTVPDAGGRLVVFENVEDGRNSKLALIFSDAHVAGGAELGAVPVDAGMASVLTPEGFAALNAHADALGPDANLYDDFFSQFSEPSGGERKRVPLPNGIEVPYIHAGWGDGTYPIFSLTDADGEICAIYTDFMGRNRAGDWLLPPGVTRP